MDENVYKEFCIDIHNKLKNTINASINCKINSETDVLYVNINRLGIEYDMSIKNISNVIKNGTDEIDKCFTKIVKSYKNFIKHKFFY